MSKITLPPLPEALSCDIQVGVHHGTLSYYTAEQMQERDRQVVEHVIRACADLCAAEQAENRGLAKGSKTAMYEWMADGAGLCRGAILALLEPKE